MQFPGMGQFGVAPQSPILALMLSARSIFVGVGLLSGVINLLMLTGSLFMMLTRAYWLLQQRLSDVFDR